MGSFWGGSPSGTIKHEDLDKHLRELDLKPHEREFVKGKLDQYQNSGINHEKLSKVFREIKSDDTDTISSQKADKIHQHLKGKLTDDHNE